MADGGVIRQARSAAEGPLFAELPPVMPQPRSEPGIIEETCREAGYEPPTICTPEELTED